MPDVLEALSGMLDALVVVIDRELPSITDDALHNDLNAASRACGQAAARIEQIQEARRRP